LAQHLIQTPLAKEQQITHIDPQTVEVKAEVLVTPPILEG